MKLPYTKSQVLVQVVQEGPDIFDRKAGIVIKIAAVLIQVFCKLLIEFFPVIPFAGEFPGGQAAHRIQPQIKLTVSAKSFNDQKAAIIAGNCANFYGFTIRLNPPA